MTLLCHSTFQFGLQSLCTEVNTTTVCNQEGIWEPITDVCDNAALPGANHHMLKINDN